MELLKTVLTLAPGSISMIGSVRFAMNEARKLNLLEKDALRSLRFYHKEQRTEIKHQALWAGFFPVFYTWKFPANTFSNGLSGEQHKWLEFEIRHPLAKHLLRPYYDGKIPRATSTSIFNVLYKMW